MIKRFLLPTSVIVLTFALLGAVLLTAPRTATAQTDGNTLCAHVPSSIPKGDTEQIEIQITLAGVPAPTGEGWTCETMQEVYPVMGVGISGVRISNFEIDPSEPRQSATLNASGANVWLWSINATGDENSRHNLLVYTYVDDESRSAGYRSLTRIPMRVEIKEGGPFAFLGQLIDTTAGRIAAVAGAITALTGAVLAIRKLLGGGNA